MLVTAAHCASRPGSAGIAGSRPKSWWKLGSGATLSGSPFLTTCYAASKYLSRTETSNSSEITSLAA